MTLSILKVILAPTLDAAKATWDPDVTVEAEYGSHVVTGRVLTLAHHQSQGPWSTAGGARAPCCDKDQVAGAAAELRRVLDDKGHVKVLISHFDLDTVGGIGRVLAALTSLTGDESLFDGHESFWRLAEFVDLNGPHRAHKSPDASEQNLLALQAFWARSRAAKPASGDVSLDVASALATLADILIRRDKNMLLAGKIYADEQEALERKSLIEELPSGVVVRCYTGFVNHLYGKDGRAVVAFNPETGAVTVSLADPVTDVSCRQIVQDLFGPEAGGHDGIAGSPRGKRMTFEDWACAIEAMDMELAS